MDSYQQLTVWQKAMDLTTSVYELTASFPKEERYSLVDQMRRAAISIPSNIAEGKGRKSQNDFKHFLSIARGSVNELETQILLSERLSYTDKEKSDKIIGLADEVGKMINGLINSLC